MRSISIVVKCDACHSEIEEETEGDSVVRFEARGTAFEMDLCNDCTYGSFLQEGRPTTERKNRKGEHACFCGKSFGTARGLSAHQTRQAHD